MHKILGSLLLSLSFLAAGSITSTVNTTKVIAGESLMLTIAVTGEDSTEIPDIPEIDGQKVYSNKRRPDFNLVHINGKSSIQKTKLLVLELRPKSDMVIPSFTVNVDGKLEKTEPIKITLVKPTLGAKRETKDFSIEMKLAKEKFYLGESIILNIYFKQRSSLDLLKVEYTPPKFKNFFFKQIGKENTVRKGKFTIQELNYQLIAKKAGNLTLEPASVKIAERSRQRQKSGLLLDIPKWTKISSSMLPLEVIEPSVAHDLVGKYKLSESIDHLKVKANKPVTLHLSLEGDGDLDEYEGIKYEIPSVTIYRDEANVTNKIINKKLHNLYQKSFVFISDHDFEIPSKELRFFNPRTGEVELLKTKAYYIEVESGEKATPTSSVHKHITMQGAKVDYNATKCKSWYKQLAIWLALLLAFLLGVFATLSLEYFPDFVLPRFGKREKSFDGEDALKVLYPKVSESKAVEIMVRKLYAIKHGAKGIEINKKQLQFLVEKYK